MRNIMTKDTKEIELLFTSLTSRKPILFLGAGFSYGSLCNGQAVPLANDLRELLYSEFYEINCPANLTDEDKKYLKALDLSSLCNAIQSDGRGGILTKKLISVFKGTTPNPSDPYQELLCDYYWDKIYTLNIDDLVENIYNSKRIPFVVQNEVVRKPSQNIRQIIKLHGCVNNPEGGFVFSSNEYAINTALEDYRLKEFAQDYFKNDIIFLGTEFNETDIQVLLEKNKISGFVNTGINYFFISPKIGYTLKHLIDSTENFHYINWNAKIFLIECAKLNKHSKDIETQERLLEQSGFLKVQNYMNVPEDYESKLYYGNDVNFYDIFANWDIINSKTSDIIQKIDREGKTGSYVVAIYGKAFTGKTVVATRLLVELYKKGYDAYSYGCEGEDELIELREYFNLNTNVKKAAILIDDAAYLYESIVKVFNLIPPHMTAVVFILVSDYNNHISKRHELTNFNGREWQISDQFNDKSPRILYDKLKEKNRLGFLRRCDEKTALSKIKENRYLVECLFQITNGEGFKLYFKKRMENFLGNSSADDYYFLKYICVLSKLGIHNLKEQLIRINCPNLQTKQLDGLVVGFGESCGVSLRCAEAYDDFLYGLPEDERLEIVYTSLISIANMFREEENNRWKNIFEKLLNARTLHKNLKISPQKLISLFARIEKYYGNVSYFWLQRGLAKQIIHEYNDASNFLNQALSIRPNSYQIRHAIAKNKLEEAMSLLSDKSRHAEAWDLFEIGRSELVELIESPRFSKNIGYSVHSYIKTTIKFYRITRFTIASDEIIKMREFLIASCEQSYDHWMRDCRSDLFAYCKENSKEYAALFEVNKFEKYKRFNFMQKI